MYDATRITLAARVTRVHGVSTVALPVPVTHTVAVLIRNTASFVIEFRGSGVFYVVKETRATIPARVLDPAAVSGSTFTNTFPVLFTTSCEVKALAIPEILASQHYEKKNNICLIYIQCTCGITVS